MPNHAKWRTHRKAMHSALSVTAVHKYKPIQDCESRRLAYNLMQDPTNFFEIIERCASQFEAVAGTRSLFSKHR